MGRVRDYDDTIVSACLDGLKRHLRITADDLDDDLREKLLAADNYCERIINRIIINSTFHFSLEFTEGGFVVLPTPVISIDSVKLDGVSVEYVTSGSKLAPKCASGSLEVVCESGMGQIPEDILHAILIKAASMFGNPVDYVEQLVNASQNLLRPYRTYGEDGNE